MIPETVLDPRLDTPRTLPAQRWLLQHTDRPVTQIALDCGFADPPQFSRTYRKQYQVKPSHSRKNR
jgi:transcriptional regulator GlxA family with amidase domain